MPIQLVIFDLDDTLIASTIRTKKPYSTVELIPGVLDKLSAIRAKGVQVAIVTNQRGVAFNYQSPRDVWNKFNEVKNLLSLPYDTIFKVCFHDSRSSDPDWNDLDKSQRAKPSPRMINEVIAALNITDNRNVLMVGDSNDDYVAAAAANVSFCWANVYFSSPNSNQPLAPSIPGYTLTKGQ